MNRRGTSLLEVVVATVLLAVMMTLCLRMAQSAAASHRALEQRQLAIHEAGNVMQRLMSQPWDTLTAQKAGETKLSGEVQQRLDGAELKVDITTPSDDSGSKRIAVAIGWQDREGKTLPPVRLVAWKWREAAESQHATSSK